MILRPPGDFTSAGGDRIRDSESHARPQSGLPVPVSVRRPGPWAGAPSRVDPEVAGPLPVAAHPPRLPRARLFKTPG